MTIVPIILCGGSGTRLWPASREGYPKQFLSLGGELSLFQATVARVAELDRHAPDIAGPAREAAELARRDLDFLRLDETAFAAARGQSVDHAVMEKTGRAAVLASRFAWSDLGSWRAMHALGDKDGAGNVVSGDAVIENTRNSLVHATHGLAAVVGLDEVMVIATRDAVLVAPLGAAAEIKELVARLGRAGRREATDHTEVYRPWGSFESLDMGARHQVKRISVVPGGRLSLQSHKHRAEHWVVVAGTARVTVDDTVKLLGENESIHVPLGAVHRLENPGDTQLEIIEVQTGSYLGEDDILRYEDVYNRG